MLMNHARHHERRPTRVALVAWLGLALATAAACSSASERSVSAGVSGSTNPTSAVSATTSTRSSEQFCELFVSLGSSLLPPADPFGGSDDSFGRQYQDAYSRLAESAPLELREDLVLLQGSLQKDPNATWRDEPYRSAVGRVETWVRTNCR